MDEKELIDLINFFKNNYIYLEINSFTQESSIENSNLNI